MDELETLEPYTQETVTQIALGNLSSREKQWLEEIGDDGFRLITLMGCGREGEPHVRDEKRRARGLRSWAMLI